MCFLNQVKSFFNLLSLFFLKPTLNIRISFIILYNLNSFYLWFLFDIWSLSFKWPLTILNCLFSAIWEFWCNLCPAIDCGLTSIRLWKIWYRANISNNIGIWIFLFNAMGLCKRIFFFFLLFFYIPEWLKIFNRLCDLHASAIIFVTILKMIVEPAK